MKFNGIKYLFLVLPLLLVIQSCEEDNEVGKIKTAEEQTLVEYIRANPDQYSEFEKLLDISGLYGILNARGAFTAFLPDNEAVKEFLEGRNPESMEKDYVGLLVRSHFLTGKYVANDMVPGTVADSTFAGNFVSLDFRGGGLNNILVNKRAVIKSRDTECSNGVVHTLDKVLLPITRNTFEVIRENGNFNVFADALELTGWSEELKKVVDENGSECNFTVLLESDELLNAKGIGSAEELAALYTESDDYTSRENGFNRFVAYHCLLGSYYTSNFKTFNYSAINGDMLNVDVEDGFKINPQFNEFGELTEFNTFEEPAKLNYQATNGVIHELVDVMTPSESRAIEVVDYVLDQPELKWMEGLDKESRGVDADDVARWEAGGDWSTLTIRMTTCGKYGMLSASKARGWFNYTTIPIAKGTYSINGRTNNWISGSYRVYIDGEYAGIYDPRGGQYSMGTFTFHENGTHLIRLETFRPGRFGLGCITFSPVRN
ncbi:hypothetical protein FUAX_28750 [Fulvitalea axinellae]|uniref:FAS1 domain-containing protein n=1 Tax=Fulvitalea axinellae TaxID=1182444 RepID=A0AAU9CQS8_9BACT|nr:hypothetical protein FUAX_28750 [Fulvitalea axinellae]